MEDLAWLGLDWDEGPNEGEKGEKGACGPYRQSERSNIYEQHTQFLLTEEKAYRCFCTPEELEQERKLPSPKNFPRSIPASAASLSEKKIAANMSKGMSYAVRLKIPDRPIRFHDIVRGDLDFRTLKQSAIPSSCVRQRADRWSVAGVPVYNYVVTVDDALMDITHVIRGDDHISNTPKQVAIYEAFGWPVPQFAHLSTILGADRERLSKRHGATSMAELSRNGLSARVDRQLPGSPRLGCRRRQDRNLSPPEQLIKAFSLERVTPSPAIFDFEKLNWINRHYMKLAPPARLAAVCWDYFGGLLPEKARCQ